MMRKKTKLIIIFFIGLFIIFIGILLLINAFTIIKNDESSSSDYICMPKKEFNDIQNKGKDVIQNNGKIEDIAIIREKIEDVAIIRDKKVLNDQLYPPLARTDRLTFDSVAYETEKRNINIPIKDIGDTYRLVGYLTSKSEEIDSGGNKWKLMARQKDRNETDFYAIPVNNNYDIKVHLSPEICHGQRIRDIYTIPKELKFKSPLLNNDVYEFVELPKTDFSSPFI